MPTETDFCARTDALGRVLRVPRTPLRIVSLVPSQTELLFALGCGARTVAVSDYCIHPEEGVAALPRVGGQKDPDLAVLRALAPDLVVGNKEENLRRDVERLDAAGIPVYVTDVRTLAQALALPGELGALCAAPPDRTGAVAAAMAAGVAAARAGAAARGRRLRAIAAVWREPWIVAGPDTYMHAVLDALGIDNAAAALDRTQRYPKVRAEQIRALAPEFILLPSEPYPFTPAHLAPVEAELGIPARLCDGTIACWYGPRTARIAALHASLTGL